MANSAYLFASNSDDGYGWRLPVNGEYFNSRWVFPAAWWYLFSPADIRFVEVGPGRESWNVLRFVADREAAIERFKKRRSQLETLLIQESDNRLLDFLVSVLSNWPVRYLLCNPDEILEGDAEEEIERVTLLFEHVERGTVTEEKLQELLCEYSTIRSPENDDYNSNLIGNSFGETGQRLWSKIMGGTPWLNRTQ